MSPHPPRGARRAFTLVELLVVVGIIAVLVALLLPALRAAARRADAVACLSNLRQIGHAHTLYRTDHKGATPLYRGDGYWADAYRRYFGNAANGDGNAGRLLHCPSADADDVDRASAVSAFGSATRPWSYPRPLSGGYGFNGFVHTADLFGLVMTQDITFNEWFVRRDTKEAPRVPLAGDCTWSIAWPTARDRTPPDLHAGDRAQQGPPPLVPNLEDPGPPGILAGPINMTARFAIARHGRAINVAFLDGHAERVPLEELKRLKWHEGYLPTDWNPPLPP